MAKGHSKSVLAVFALVAVASAVPAHAQEQSQAANNGRLDGEFNTTITKRVAYFQRDSASDRARRLTRDAGWRDRGVAV